MKHRRKAEKDPSKYMSLIIDGMDQQKTNIPHIISNPKVIDYINFEDDHAFPFCSLWQEHLL